MGVEKSLTGQISDWPKEEGSLACIQAMEGCKAKTNAPEEDLPVLANIAHGERLWLPRAGERGAGCLLGFGPLQGLLPKDLAAIIGTQQRGRRFVLCRVRLHDPCSPFLCNGIGASYNGRRMARRVGECIQIWVSSDRIAVSCVRLDRDVVEFGLRRLHDTVGDAVTEQEQRRTRKSRCDGSRKAEALPTREQTPL